jgi:uncharacterized protein YgiM (DUF1202 family)/tetratricopeptide (TPR) repeat protein
MRGMNGWRAAVFAIWLLLAAAPAAARLGLVNTNDLNLRSSPQITHNNILLKLNAGDRVTILGSDSRWLKVRASDGAVGWVDMDYVDEATPATVNTNDLNLRATPDIRSDNIIGKLNSGDSITIFGRDGRWLHVRTQSGQAGWVDMDYVDEAGAPTGTRPGATSEPGRPTPPATGGEPGRVNADLLNLRSAPDITADNVVGQLVLDTAVTVLETRGEWMRIRTQSGATGWVATVYIDRGGNADPESLLKTAQDIFHSSYSIEKITFLDGSEEFKQYKPAKVMEAYNIVDRLLRTPGFTEHDTALLLRGKCLAVIGWYSDAYDPKFFALHKGEYRANESDGNYVYLGGDYKTIKTDYPGSNLEDDAAFELANLPRPGDCEGKLDCHFKRELDAFGGFITEYPESPFVRRSIELINAASLDVLMLADDVTDNTAGNYSFDRQALLDLIDRYRKLLSNHPSNDRVYALHAIADAYVALGLKDRALPLYEAIVDKFPRYEMITHIKQSIENLKKE